MVGPAWKFRAFLPLAVVAGLVMEGAPPELRGADLRLNPVAADAYSRRHGGLVLIIHTAGRPDFSSYRSGIHSRTPLPVFSITKSFAALACLDLRGFSPDRVVRGQSVTLRHLLSQTSGIAAGYKKLYKKKIPNVRVVAAGLPQVTPPGKVFSYGPSHYEFLGGVLSPDGDHSDRAQLVLGRFLNRLGVRPSGWRTDLGGRIYLSTGAVVTPGELLKIGRHLLKMATDFSPFSRGARIRQAFVGSEANPAYGMGFWLNRPGRNSTEVDIEMALASPSGRHAWDRMCLSHAAPPDLVCMAGSGGQRVYVIPSLGTVVVRLGQPSGFQDPLFLKALFRLCK